MKRTVNSVRNVVWANYENTLVEMEVDFVEMEEEYVPFLANPNDSEPHGVDLYNRAVAGEFGPIGDYTPPANITGDSAMERLRRERTRLLEQTDYIEMPTKWATLTADEQALWATYRNALRDLPADYPNASYVYDAQGNGSWSNVTWPTRPE